MKAIDRANEAQKLPIYAFFVGSAISYIGDMLTLLAIPWFVLLTTGSVTRTGITAFFSTLPAVFSAFFGSAIIDRLGYTRTSVIGDIASACTVMLVPLLYHTVGLAFWQLLALVFLGGLLKSPGVTARSSLVPDLAGAASMRLERANSLWDGVNRVSGLIGAPLAGFLIATIGTSNLLWLDAASFAVSAILIGWAIPSTPPVVNKEAEDSARHYLATFIKQVFHSAVPLGLIVAALGGASFVGTIIFGAIGHRFPRRLTFGLGYTLGGPFRFWVLLLPGFASLPSTRLPIR